MESPSATTDGSANGAEKREEGKQRSEIENGMRKGRGRGHRKQRGIERR